MGNKDDYLHFSAAKRRNVNNHGPLNKHQLP